MDDHSSPPVSDELNTSEIEPKLTQHKTESNEVICTSSEPLPAKIQTKHENESPDCSASDTSSAPKRIKIEIDDSSSVLGESNPELLSNESADLDFGQINGSAIATESSEKMSCKLEVSPVDPSASCGVSFEGVISFNSEDSTCTLSVRIDSEGIFKVVTANVFTFQDYSEDSRSISDEILTITKRDLTSERLNLKANLDCQKTKNGSLNFMLCFACNTSYSDLSGLSEHGKVCHNCEFSEDDFSFFAESQSSVVFHPTSSCETTKDIAVLGLDNIREVSLESLKLASKHLIQEGTGVKNEDEDANDIISSIFSSENGMGNYSAATIDFNSTSNNILTHMAMCHSRNSSKTLKCPKCNWHYKYQQTLDAHMKEKHSDSLNTCEYCTTNEPHPKLARGETYSCGYKPFKCEVCNYSTTTKGNLSIHMQSDKHLNNVQELKRNNGTLEETSNGTSATISAVTQSGANQSASNLSESIGANMQSTNFFKCPACEFQTVNAASFKVHIATEHALLSMNSGNNSANDLASALLNQQQQTTNDILQSLILQRQLEAVAAVTSNPEASLFIGGMDGILPQINHAAGLTANSAGVNESGVFTCSLCNRFCSDDAHLIQNHALRDRTSITSQDYSTVNNNTFKCLLCNYSTNLKANFTLHSQTEKHKQKVQIFNHLKEGNENLDAIFTIIHQISPIQITCNACDFQAKSIGQLNAHLTADAHVLAVKLFEIFTSLTSKPGAKVNCKVCASGFMSKPEIISHVQQTQHCSKLRNKKLQSGNSSNEANSWHDFFEVSVENCSGNDRNGSSNSSSAKSSEIYGEAFNCPLCAKPSRTRDLLREHIMQDHRVSTECIEALLSVVKPTMSVKPVARTTPRVAKSNSESTSEPVASGIPAASSSNSQNALVNISGVLKYRCHRCRSEFNHTVDLYNHAKSCTNYVCYGIPDCKEHFPTHNALSNHIAVHADQDSSLPCWDPKCGQNFLSEETLILHFFDTVGHLPLALTCSTCLTTFLNETTFSTHVLNSSCSNQHSGQINSQADFKNDILDSLPIVSQYSASSLSSRPHHCSNCNFAYVLQSNLQSHINTAHTEVPAINNSERSASEVNASRVSASAEPTRAEKPFRCEACDVAYSSESTLVIHLASLLHKETVNRQSNANNQSSSSPDSSNSEMACSSQLTPGCNSMSSVDSTNGLNNDNSSSNLQTTAESFDDVVRSLSQQQQSANAMTSSLAAMNFLSNMGMQVSPHDLKVFQDTFAATQQLQNTNLLDVQTQMALLQQQQFLLQHQKLLSSLMPLYNATPQVGQQSQEGAMDQQQLTSQNSKLNELFKISISGQNSSDENSASGILNTNDTNAGENDGSNSIKIDKKINTTTENSSTSREILPTGKYQSVIVANNSPTSTQNSVKIESGMFESSTPTRKVPGNLQIAEEPRCESSGNFQDEDDDNMFYSDELTQSESDGGGSDGESHSGSSFGSGDQLNATNAFILQQAALYQQLFMQNPAALSAILPAAALANSNFGSQMFANNPILSMIASAANGGKTIESVAPESSQKQPRTKISEPQLEILKQNFDISNLPSEEKYIALSQQTGLPVKVIKHWFRNTLFKERQKDKDSPYNFNNPPSCATSSSSSSVSQNTLSLQQAIFNNMQSLLPGSSSNPGQFDPTKFNLSAFGTTSPGKPPSPMTMFLQQQNQQHMSSKRATRTRFTDHQIKSLQDFFDQNPYPRDDDLENLSKSLSLSPRVVVVWFQNQRQKARRSMELSGPENSNGQVPQVSVCVNEPRSSSSISDSSALRPNSVSSTQSSRSNLDHDATKLVQEVVNMVAVNHGACTYNEAEQDPVPTTAQDFTTVVEPQPAPNYDVMSSIASSVAHQIAAEVSSREAAGAKLRNRDNESNKLVIKDESDNDGFSQNTQDDEEFYYNCSLCPAILASEDELDAHQRAHIEQVALTISGLSSQQDQQNESCNDLDAMQRINEKFTAMDKSGNFNGVSNNASYLSDAQGHFDANGAGSQEYFRRMRTTISPDQLEILYTKYGENSNPSRTEMETIASSVGLSRRVVQVWYQNTRARQRRGQCRVIGNTVYHCKCPYCETICKSKSHLSQHVQKEHSDRAKNAIQIAPSTLDSSGVVRSSAPPNVTIGSKPSDGKVSGLVGVNLTSAVSTHDPKPLESLVASVSSIVSAASRNFGTSLKSFGVADGSGSGKSSFSDIVSQVSTGKCFDDGDDSKLHEVSFYSDGSK